jgi:hypothetical protein
MKIVDEDRYHETNQDDYRTIIWTGRNKCWNILIAQRKGDVNDGEAPGWRDVYFTIDTVGWPRTAELLEMQEVLAIALKIKAAWDLDEGTL